MIRGMTLPGMLFVCLVAAYGQAFEPVGPNTIIQDNRWGPYTVDIVPGPFDLEEANRRALAAGWLSDPYLRNIVPRMSETLDVEISADGKLTIAWDGRSEFLSGAYVALLDKSKKEVLRHRFEKLPISYSKEPPKEAAYYRLVLTYVNGAVSTFTGPIQVPAKSATEEKTPAKQPTVKDTTGLLGP
ncbi:MAG: hypothetical protein AMXMBFR61_20650 [Fimbriimonadales bacterium]